MVFGCLAPAVAFGGLMAVMTDGAIGIVEMLVATAACGVVYALANISGGQLKRTSIGIELVALSRPAALLLDGAYGSGGCADGTASGRRRS